MEDQPEIINTTIKQMDYGRAKHIIDDYRSGKTIIYIRNTYHVSFALVKKILVLNNIPIRKQSYFLVDGEPSRYQGPRVRKKKDDA